MGELLSRPVTGNLSADETALLLLAAWLHDIGMVPSVARLRQHRNYLLTGQTSLDSDHQRHFRHFLDDTRPDLAFPFPANTPAGHSLVHSLIAAYARHRHNDWSSTWTRHHFYNNSTLPGGYAFVDDLVHLCESHHWSIGQVRIRNTSIPAASAAPPNPSTSAQSGSGAPRPPAPPRDFTESMRCWRRKMSAAAAP